MDPEKVKEDLREQFGHTVHNPEVMAACTSRRQPTATHRVALTHFHS